MTKLFVFFHNCILKVSIIIVEITGTYLPFEMSPASKSKSKDKKAGKEPQKASSKPPGSANAGSGISASAYNPLSGTFHTIETVSTSSASPLHSNGRFRNIDETDDHPSGLLGAGVEYDSVSNNGSWSGESEDHKEKTSNHAARQETIPGADNDKREKIRQKNERKHQRQKERRAQELYERCTGYLMSRKLEALAQQLVAMGFLHDRATMALILNEGKLEESVTWLFEVGEHADKHRDQNLSGSTLKIDISEELARITEMEIRYKCTKREVERAVVASEGDLEKAMESLRQLKLDAPSAPPKPEETADPPASSNDKLSLAGSQNMVRPQPKVNPSSLMQQRRDKDFNYTKPAAPVVGSLESGSKNGQPLTRIQPKLDWPKPHPTATPTDKIWSSVGSNPSVSYSVASPLQVPPPPAKTETRYAAVGSEYKSLHPGTVREPVIMMQRPQSVNSKQVPATSINPSPPGTAAAWYPTNSADIMKSNGLMPPIPSTRSRSPNNLSSNQTFHHFHYQQLQHFVPSNGPGDSPGTSKANGLWNRAGASPSLAAAASLGLFSGLGSTGSSEASSPVDWSTSGSMAQLDYTSIDWSLDRGLSSPRHGGFWLGPTNLKSSAQTYDSSASGFGARLAMRPAPSGNGIPVPGLQDGGVDNSETSTPGSLEWTSPFEGNDIFGLSRQFVSSPSL
ncbi:UBIQUITIN-ASSOCIATED/TRANSLATION ELONGATION FACTOR EF1B PROTEIN [Salix koriyanagi]|uniref:UBIQUITIN-ASSOCIATED/TRANSLATION ELONGATION FACTOR EF1B PROTEIN n=1 Tax=Salix koriyanagi TaxID=2511006 RepID=A0A9Q0YZI7_9ROSI|nr:UBIQUITIN-ASSOCIATED/TRANSLATION ELONGATION FACTOR EF1B PROTEIN [Salix koriyanagi]